MTPAVTGKATPWWVDVSNLNSKARFGRTAEFTTENVHVVERFIFDRTNQRFNYVATFTDPAAFSRPFTVTVPARRWTVADKTNEWHYEVPLANNPGKPPTGDHLERICVENNGGFGRLPELRRRFPLRFRLLHRRPGSRSASEFPDWTSSS